MISAMMKINEPNGYHMTEVWSYFVTCYFHLTLHFALLNSAIVTIYRLSSVTQVCDMCFYCFHL